MDDSASAFSPSDMFGPGSDINKSHPEQIVGHLGNTHIIALNAYPVFRPQYMLLSSDSYQSQNEAMSIADVTACWDFINSLKSPFYALFNCTRNAGCSRNHKHVQIIPRPTESSFRLFPDRNDDENEVAVPYVYFLHRFKSEELQAEPSTTEHIYSVYISLLDKARECLGISLADVNAAVPHNAILVKDWIMVIPRRSGNFKGLMANGAGMLGMPTVSTSDQLRRWQDEGPARALAKLGIAL
jgi:ATP adenylyltransferase/5',5'''-P-1,P-4-tetraphosphate phosphorylase II